MVKDVSLLVKLREKTGAGVLDCKKALEESLGDLDKALDVLKKKGIIKAASRSDKSAFEGLIYVSVSEDNHRGAILELRCETDFVAKNEIFKDLAKDVTDLAMNNNIKDKNELLKMELNGKELLSEALTNTISMFGENIVIESLYSLESKDSIESYIHSNNKIGVLIEYNGQKEVAKEIAMHIAAMNPSYLSIKDISTEVLEREKNLLLEMNKSDLDSKPKEVADRILSGKLSKAFESQCLLSQKFAKNQDITIKDYIENKVDIKSFKRIFLGEKA